MVPVEDSTQIPEWVETLPWHVAIRLVPLMLAMSVGIAFDSIETVLAMLGGFCVASFGFTLPIAATLALRATAAAGTSWFSTTRCGVAVSVAVMLFCSVVGYVSAGQSLWTLLSR